VSVIWPRNSDHIPSSYQPEQLIFNTQISVKDLEMEMELIMEE
jgi:hypothetical protein